jgi:hypothetical protein
MRGSSAVALADLVDSEARHDDDDFRVWIFDHSLTSEA